MPKANLEKSLIGTDVAEILKENNPQAYKRYLRLELGHPIYRFAKSFFNGLVLASASGFFLSDYNSFKDLYS